MFERITEKAEACSIRKSGGSGWQMHIPGGKGKKGHSEKFPSKAAARKRQREIQFFKKQG